jgi:O-antigen/teichoic acid export membrane protein
MNKKREKSLGANAILNVLKQCCSILFPLVSFPYITRVLGSEALGRYSFVDSVIGYFVLFATLGIPTYAVREGAGIRNDAKKINAFSAEVFSINCISMLISAVILGVLVFCVPRFAVEKTLFFLLSIRIFTSVIGRDWINTIYENFFFITVRYIVFELAALAMIFLFVKAPSDYMLYGGFLLLASAGPDILNIFYTKRYVPLRLTRQLNLRKHLKPALYLFSTTIAINIYVHSDITVLGFLRSDAEVGVYSLASKIYLAIEACFNALISAMVPRLAFYLGTDEQEKYQALLHKTKNVLFLIMLPSMTGLFFLSKDIMTLLGGQEYTSGYHALQILSAALFFAGLSTYYVKTLLIPNREDRYYFWVTIAAATTNVVLNILFIPKMGIECAAMTTGIAEALSAGLAGVRSRRYIKQDKNGRNGNQLHSVLIGCFSIAAVCYGVGRLHLQPGIEMLICIVGSVMVYSVALLALRNREACEILKKVRYMICGRTDNIDR